VVPKNSSIKTIDDLNGKTIATANPPSANTYLLQALLAKHGVTATLTRVLLGTEIAPMLAGRADAAVMEEPSMEDALARNYRIVYKFSAAYARNKGGYCWTAVDAMGDSIAKRGPVVQGFVDAIAEALATIAKDPAAATEVAAREFPSFSPDRLRVAIGRYTQEGLFPASPILTETQFANAVDVQAKAGNLKAAEAKYAETVDASFAQHPSR
jgi:NitT/TauT family transport system substrate-binding protein